MVETRLSRHKKIEKAKEIIPSYYGPSIFELFSNEVLYQILDRVYGNPTKAIHFKEFWNLRLVSKQMNALLSTEYARKRYTRSTCKIYLSSAFDLDAGESRAEAMTFVKVEAYIGDEVLIENADMLWSELPEFFSKKNIRVKKMIVLYTPMGEEAFNAIKVLADQSIQTLKVVIQDSPFSWYLSVKYRELLQPLIEAGKIKYRHFKHHQASNQANELNRLYRIKIERHFMLEVFRF
ncbi:unnamed protein product [Auanema sp. JU1783]|nr:unnamed protein product [Auanema sp. JU1783]